MAVRLLPGGLQSFDPAQLARGILRPGTATVAGRKTGGGEQARNQRLAEERARAQAQAEQRAREETIRKAQADARRKADLKRQANIQKQQQQRNENIRKKLLRNQRQMQLINRKVVKTFSQQQRLLFLGKEKIKLQRAFTRVIIPTTKIITTPLKFLKKRVDIQSAEQKKRQKRIIKFVKGIDFSGKTAVDKLFKKFPITDKIFKGATKGDVAFEMLLKEQINQSKFISPRDKALLIITVEQHAPKIKQVLEFEKGALEGVREEPVKTGAVAVTSFFAPGVLARIGGAKVVTKVLSKIPLNIRKKGAAAISKGLTAAYTGSAGIRIVGAENKTQQAGRIFSTEIIPFKIGTTAGVKGLLRKEIKNELNLEVKKLPPKKREAFKDYMKQAELFGKFEPKAKNIELNNIENLPTGKQGKIAGNVIRKFLKEKDLVVGGSVAQTGQIKVSRKLGDIDVYAEKGSPSSLAKELAKRLKKAGVKRVTVLRGEARIGGKKSLEIHDIERVLTNIKQVIPSWQSPRRYIIKTPEGIRIQRIGLQAKRKLVAAFADPKRRATGKFKKDLQDFKAIADKLFINAERKARGAFFFKDTKIKNVEKIFGKKITKVPKPKKPTPKPKPKPKPTTKKFTTTRKSPKKTITKKFTTTRRPPKKPKPKKPRASQPSQPRVRGKGGRFVPSQPPTKPKKPDKFIPSQPPTKPKKPKPKPIPPRIPRPKPKPSPPSQPPTKPRKRKIPKIPFSPKKPFPPKEPTKKKEELFPTAFKTKKKKLKPKKIQQGFHVFARPLKKRKGSKKPKLVKVSKKALTKTQAQDLRNWLLDTSLARTGSIKATIQKPTTPNLKFPRGYATKTAFKFRKVKIRRKKKLVLVKGKVIERSSKGRNFLLDTRAERLQITLRQRIKQIRKQPKKKKSKRKAKTEKFKRRSK